MLELTAVHFLHTYAYLSSNLWNGNHIAHAICAGHGPAEFFFTWRVWQLFDGAISSRRDVMSVNVTRWWSWSWSWSWSSLWSYGLMVIIILILTLILIRSIFFLELTLHSQRPKTPAARGCLTLGWHGFWSHPSPKRCPAAIDSMAMGEPSITKVCLPEGNPEKDDGFRVTIGIDADRANPMIGPQWTGSTEDSERFTTHQALRHRMLHGAGDLPTGTCFGVWLRCFFF